MLREAEHKLLLWMLVVGDFEEGGIPANRKQTGVTHSAIGGTGFSHLGWLDQLPETDISVAVKSGTTRL